MEVRGQLHSQGKLLYGMQKVNMFAIMNPYHEYPAAISLSFIGRHLTTTCTASFLFACCG
jgi:hypothetical protein